jgi:uncharacterized protein (TIGR02117 family)
VVAAAAGLYPVAAGLGSRMAVGPGADPLGGSVGVFFVSNGVHVDVWLPARSRGRDWAAWLPSAVPVAADGYVAFGWGSREFFLAVPTWDDLTAGIALRALFVPGEAAMHVTDGGAPAPGAHVHLVRLTPQRLAELAAFVEGSFALDAAGRARLLDDPGYGAGDRFFVARGSYRLFRTCNVWTTEALRAAGLQAALWAPLEHGLRQHLPHNHGQAASP